MIHNPTFEGPQTVERVAILAYLDADTLVEVDAIIVNDDLRYMDLKGHSPYSFNDLLADVRCGLEWHGYRVDYSRHAVQMSYFSHLGNHKPL